MGGDFTSGTDIGNPVAKTKSGSARGGAMASPCAVPFLGARSSIVVLRYAMRSLARNPLFTGVAVLSLGLALALNTTMFSLVDAVLHPYVPYPEPDRIATVAFLGGDRNQPVSFDDRHRAVRDGVTGYDAFASYVLLPTMVQTSTVGEDHYVAAVSPNLFGLLGVRPMAGRGFATPQTGEEVIISFRAWNRLFAGRPLENGLRLVIGRSTYTVVGVMPRAVHFPAGADFWIALDGVRMDSTVRRVGPVPVLHLVAGVSVETVKAQLGTVASRLTAQFAQRRPLSARLLTLGPSYPGRNTFPQFIPAAVLMVLLIACANLGTMMLARGMARRRETAIRIALGAGTATVVRQVLTECALVVAGGVAIGVLLTLWALHIMPHLASPSVPDLGDIQPVPSARVFVAVLAVSVVMLVVAGVVPSLRAAATDPAEPMKEGAGTTSGRHRDRYNPLIIIEVVLSTTLLMCAALFVIYVLRLSAFQFQYAAKRLVVASLEVKGTMIADDVGVERFYEDLIVRVRQLPGARLAATRYDERPDGGVVISEEGRSGEQWLNLSSYSVVSPDFLRTFSIPLLRGRDFEQGDRGSAGVVIVSADAAKRLWPDLPTPVGRMIKLGNKASNRPWLRVIGVTTAVELRPRKDSDLPLEPDVYVVYGRDVGRRRQLVVRGDGVNGDRGRAALALALRRELENVAPTMARPWVRPWLQEYENRRASSAFMAALFGAFGAFGLGLCAVGLYGVLAYAVSRRLREFAIRIALGARRRDVARLVVHDAAVTALAGVGIGAFVALWVTRAISDELFAVGFADFFALVAAETVLFGVAILAALGPVRQATRADPVEILRAS